MQKLLCPYGRTSFYYSRRLEVQNFIITDINTRETSCHRWNESDCEKNGSCEIALCPRKYIITKDKVGYKTIHLFCDNYKGQNCNHMVVAMLSETLQTLQTIEKITLNFLVSRHSQNENDHAHSMTEGAASKKLYIQMLSDRSPHKWHLGQTKFL